MGYTRLHGFKYMNFEIFFEEGLTGSDFALNTPRGLRALGFGIDLDYPNQFISSQLRRLDKTLHFASNLNSLATLNAGVYPGGYAPPPNGWHMIFHTLKITCNHRWIMYDVWNSPKQLELVFRELKSACFWETLSPRPLPSFSI